MIRFSFGKILSVVQLLALAAILNTFSHTTASAAESQPAQPLRPYTASYLIERGDMTIGRGSYSLSFDGDRYRYESRAKAKGFLARLLLGNTEIIEYSVGKVAADGSLVPDEYFYDQGDEKRLQRINFDWNNQSAALVYKEKQKQQKLSADVQDKLSMQLAAMQAAHRGDKSLSFTVAERGRLRDYDFEVAGKETIEIAGKSYQTVIIRRRASDRQANFWMAPALGWIIVKAEQKKKDDPTIRLTMTALQWQ